MVKLQAHVESLLKGNLEEAYTFFKTNISNGAMQGHMTKAGNRVITVEGYADSIKISKVEKLLQEAATYCVAFQADEASRTAGFKLASKVRTVLNVQAEQEKKTSSVFTRFLTLDWRPAAMPVDKRLASCENMFKTYNLEQLQKAFPAINPALVEGPLWARDGDITKIHTYFSAMNHPMGGSDELPRYIDKRSNAVVVDDGTLDVNDLRLPTSEEMHTGFVVPEELIKMKLNETQVTSLYDDEPRFIPLIPPYITAQLEEGYASGSFPRPENHPLYNEKVAE